MTAVYARQSIDKGEQSLSIESQVEECVKRVVKNEAIAYYKDRGYSGSNTDRPEFMRLMDDIKCGKIHKLIVWKLDRISRSLLDFAGIMAILTDKKVSFDSVTEQLDTTSPMGRAMINIIMVFAQLERETIQMRIASNYFKRAERGFYLGGPAPFGLVKIPMVVEGYKTSTYALCPEQGHLLLWIFDWYANSDISLGALAHQLNANNHTTQHGTLWESQKLSRILHNPVYVISNADVYQYYKAKGVNIISPVDNFIGNGLHLFGKRAGNARKYSDVSGHYLAVALHQGYIDAQIWLKVQYKLAANIQLGNGGKGQYTWLSGLIKCGYCGYAMTGQKTREHVILRCSRRINFKDCEAKNIRAEPVERQVWQELLNKAEELRDVEFIQQTQMDAAENQIKMELIKLGEQIERLVAAIAEGYAPASITHHIADLEAKQMALQMRLQQEKAKITTINTEIILSMVHAHLTFEEKKSVAKALIKRVLVMEGQFPFVEWLF